MSFILDALKKSESDRQRQSGPALFEVKIAPPRSRFPLWAVAIAALLGVNAAIGGWFLLRHPSHNEDLAPAQSAAVAPQPDTTSPALQAPAPAQTAAPAGPLPAPTVASSPSSAPPSVVTEPAVAATSTPSTSTTARTPPEPIASGNSPAMGAGGRGEPTLAASGKEPQLAQAGAGQEPPGANPDDYAPATEPPRSLGPGHVKVGTSSGYVLYQDAAVVPGANIPALRLDLHVYAPKPQDRFALVNMHRVKEGDTLPEGVRVEEIIPDGVVMSHNGMKFLLPRQ
ncbi:MAG TPA: general secretion pathway protein GspB [Steroidobacteraceae bacterium]|nr:general secretion pathway protein GspB [Steroidobacteraceae bacterium]